MSNLEEVKAKPKSDKSRLRRFHERGEYDEEALFKVLDSGFLCHVGYIINGAPFVTPTLYWRHENYIYWHGSAASRMIKTSVGNEVCITVTHFDGFVMARSAFNHSVNYRSAMLFGEAEIVDDDYKLETLKHFLDGYFPGRWDMMRPMTPQEYKATSVLRMEINEFSVKSRAGQPRDDEDAAVPVWAGVLPFGVVSGEPIRNTLVPEGVEAPEHITDFDVARPFPTRR